MWPQHRYPCSPLPLSLARDHWLPLGVPVLRGCGRAHRSASGSLQVVRLCGLHGFPGVRSFENSPFHWDLCLIFLFLVLAFSIFQNSLLCS